VTLSASEKRARVGSRENQSTKNRNPKRRANLGQNKDFNPLWARKSHSIKPNLWSHRFPPLEARAKIRKKAYLNRPANTAPKRKSQIQSGLSTNTASREVIPSQGQTRAKGIRKVWGAASVNPKWRRRTSGQRITRLDSSVRERAQAIFRNLPNDLYKIIFNYSDGEPSTKITRDLPTLLRRGERAKTGRIRRQRRWPLWPILGLRTYQKYQWPGIPVDFGAVGCGKFWKVCGEA
jgi:hypothetical protein